MFTSLAAGATGFVLKQTPRGRPPGAIRDLYQGGLPLSDRTVRKVVEVFEQTGKSFKELESLTDREMKVLSLCGEVERLAWRIHVYEPRHQKPIPRPHFVRRLIMHSMVSLALIAFSLFLGMLGYHYYEALPWRDAFLNAAMLLGGMGPVESPRTDGGKLFAGFYALYSGLIFLVAAGLVIAPALHRMLHLFHWEDRRNG